MPTLDLDSRLSVPTRQLATPGPDAAQLQRILRSAVRVPDHGKRVPFRFLRIAGPARALLAVAASPPPRPHGAPPPPRGACRNASPMPATPSSTSCAPVSCCRR